MAIDTLKADGAENVLRRAMDRAGDVARSALRPQQSRTEESPLELTETDVAQRRPLRRVEVKTAMVSYIDSVFRNRTPQDGTVVGVSREQLLQELTELVMELEEHAQGVASAAAKKLSHNYGEPPRT